MVYYERNLPHYLPEGYAYFITTRLAGTIPKVIYEKIKREYEQGLEMISSLKNNKIQRNKYHELQRINFTKYENILDDCKYGHKWLGENRIAQIVNDALHYYDGKRYDLISFTIMPNHIHLVLFPIVERKSSFAQSKGKDIDSQNESGDSFYILSKIMQDIKKYTSREANKILKRKGKFWQHESYDHVVRDQKELRRIVKYILNNPVKAGLCEDIDEWEWNYFNPKYLA
ncbi:MAG: hypothetical protein GXO85_04420 [Chlorobi bacterium]|nr:hypothetical protein [Chlorobiota bacterium]